MCPKYILYLIDCIYNKYNINTSFLKSTEIISKKDSFCISIPDFMLGVWSKYIRDTYNGTKERYYNFFNNILDKYRFIADIDNNIYYERRHPFVADFLINAMKK